MRLSWVCDPEQSLINEATALEAPGIHEPLNAGDVFGEDGLVSPGHHRINAAQAATPCRLLAMNREEFLFALHESVKRSNSKSISRLRWSFNWPPHLFIFLCRTFSCANLHAALARSPICSL